MKFPNRVIVYLDPEERQALQAMAETDVRPPTDQLRFLLVNEAIRRGLLPTDQPQREELQPA